MAAPRFLVPAGVGEQMRDNYHYSQGVQVGDMIYVTGQGGWDESFSISDDVQPRHGGRALVGLDQSVLPTMVEQLRSYCPSHQPLWTVIGVASLALPAMKVEITANAAVGS